ncbi:hypothetical protein [Maritalea sp.]|uniref:hypothetical protein n=1 Tax=Maritalea sp. TaxID=2003361 RepID=UPI003EF6B47F
MKSPIKIKVLLESRPDGGIRAYSDDVAGFVLSHKSGEDVLRDIPVALEGFLSATLCTKVTVDLLVGLHTISETELDILEDIVKGPQEKEYVALCA